MEAPSSGLRESERRVPSTIPTPVAHWMPEYAMDSSSAGATSDASEDTWELCRRSTCPAGFTRRAPTHGLVFEQEVLLEDFVAEVAGDFELQSLEAKLELVSIKRRLSAFKCQKFLDELEASQKPLRKHLSSCPAHSQTQSHDHQGDALRRFKRNHTARARYTSSHQRYNFGTSEQCQKADWIPEYSSQTCSSLLVADHTSKCKYAAGNPAQQQCNAEQSTLGNSSQQEHTCEDLVGGSIPSLSPRGRRTTRPLPSIHVPDKDAEAYYQNTGRASRSARSSPRGHKGPGPRKSIS